MNELNGIPNPFRDIVVNDPWGSNTNDIAEIHGKAFDLCVEALDGVLAGGQTRSVMLYGDAGSGKSHLLRRLRARWLGDAPAQVDPIRREMVFVAAKLQSDPKYLWRFLRWSLVNDLLRKPSDALTQLQRILLRRLAEVRGADGDLLLWFEWLRASHTSSGGSTEPLEDLMDEVASRSALGHDLTAVLTHHLLDRHRLASRSWLLGEPLAEEALGKLGVAPPRDDNDPELEAREMVAALCRLSGPKVPVAFCFDQLEALQVDENDHAALFAFGNFVSELHGLSNHLLLITLVQMRLMEGVKGSVSRPSWARMAGVEHTLQSLGKDEAARLVASRLDAVPKLRALRQGRADEPLWPIPGDLLARKSFVSTTPRRVLTACANEFDALQGRSPNPVVDLNELWKERLKKAKEEFSAGDDRDPKNREAVVSHGLPLLLKETHPELKRFDDPAFRRDVPLAWRGPDGRVGIHLSFARDMRSVWRPFDRLGPMLRQGQIERLFVIRDPKSALAGPGTLQRFEALINEGVRNLSPSDEAIAALDVLRTLLSDAKAGDLVSGGEAVRLETIKDWLAENLPDDLRRLADGIADRPVGGPTGTGDDLLAQGLEELLKRRPLLSVEAAAAELATSPGALEQCVKARRDAFGLIEGPPAVLFRPIALNATESARA